MNSFSLYLTYVGLGLLTTFSNVAVAQESVGEAQALVITNARIIDGKGKVIERGAVVVKDGKIISVSESISPMADVMEIDANGMTLMPGFIDGHRHIIRGNPDQWMNNDAAAQMQSFLDAGFTTVMSCGDPMHQILDLRQKLADGDIKGPRLLVAGWLSLTQSTAPRPSGDPARAVESWAPRTTATGIPHEETRAAIQKLSEAGVDRIKTVLMVTPDGPETETLKLAVAEGHRMGLPVVTHAVTVMDTLAAVEAGVSSLVHTPVDGEMSEEHTQLIAQSGIPMMSTLGVFVPFFNDDNEPVFRDGTPFPWERLYHAGEGAVNARLLWNAGTTLGFGTDTAFNEASGLLPADKLAHEIRSLSLVFSPTDIVNIMGSNSAEAVGLGSKIGSIEAGKMADLVLLEGDPLTDSDALLAVRVVVKNGQLVVDKR